MGKRQKESRDQSQTQNKIRPKTGKAKNKHRTNKIIKTQMKRNYMKYYYGTVMESPRRKRHTS